MKCKDCDSFKPDINLEVGEEISPNVKAMKGKCNINDRNCTALDTCGCNGFAGK